VGSKRRRVKELAATTSAVAWTFSEADDCDVKRIALKFSAAPVTSEDITVTLDSVKGAAYDTVLGTLDPLSSTSVTFEDICGLANGDKILVSYTNTDARSITGTATLEL
jgi:hypothetical protein